MKNPMDRKSHGWYTSRSLNEEKHMAATTSLPSKASVQVKGISNKYQLATRMAGQSKAPKQALEAIFKGAMDELVRCREVTIAPSLYKRVWEKVSEERIKTLNRHFLNQYCYLILGTFTEKESAELLAQHKSMNFIPFGPANIRIQVAYKLNYDKIIGSLMEEAESMISKWIPEIVETLKEEGVKFSQPKMSKIEEGKLSGE